MVQRIIQRVVDHDLGHVVAGSVVGERCRRVDRKVCCVEHVRVVDRQDDQGAEDATKVHGACTEEGLCQGVVRRRSRVPVECRDRVEQTETETRAGQDSQSQVLRRDPGPFSHRAS